MGVGVGGSVSAGGCCHLDVLWSKDSRVEVKSVVGGVNHDVTQDQCACSDSDTVRSDRVEFVPSPACVCVCVRACVCVCVLSVCVFCLCVSVSD